MTQKTDLVIKICGSAGDGAISVTEMLNRAAASMGLHIMNFDSYPAEIRGFGKSLGHTRISNTRVLTPGNRGDCLIALNDVHAITELGNLKENCFVIYDSKPPSYAEEDCAIAGFIEPGWTGIGVPLRELSVRAVKSARSRNIVALGAVAALYELSPDAFIEAINTRFAHKMEAVRTSSVAAFTLGYDYVIDELKVHGKIDRQTTTMSATRNEITILSGNEAAGRGCIDAGVRLYAGYPITPATKIMEFLAKNLPKHGGVFVQTEDEIAAIGHAIGGGFAGKRALTATSGPGLSLMVESFNLAVMAEIPVVIINSQRGSPSTGLPTKTEQSDLNLAMLGASGDSPRPVLAPANVEECYTLVRKSFELAEAYQTPVIVLMDFFLSNRFEDLTPEDLDHDGYGSFPQLLAEPGPEEFKRYALTETGISPRSYPGMEGLYHAVTGLEHDESGRPNYEYDNHDAMTRKRYRKMDKLKEAFPPPETTGPDGDLEIGIISWGSTIGTARESIEILRKQGLRVGGFFPRLLYPFNTAALKAFSDRCKRLVSLEMNYTGQLTAVLRQNLNRDVESLCRVYSKPMPSEDVIAFLNGDGDE